MIRSIYQRALVYLAFGLCFSAYAEEVKSLETLNISVETDVKQPRGFPVLVYSANVNFKTDDKKLGHHWVQRTRGRR
jgi:hypothetical protein